MSKGYFDNFDFLRLVLLFCSEKYTYSDKEIQIIRKFRYATKLQKIIFLAQNEFEEFNLLSKNGKYKDTPFNFTADSFGPFSKDIVILTKKLKKNGEIELIKENERTSYILKDKLIDKVKTIIDLFENDTFETWIKKVRATNSLSLHDLLSYIYKSSKYKSFIVNSKIKDRF